MKAGHHKYDQKDHSISISNQTTVEDYEKKTTYGDDVLIIILCLLRGAPLEYIFF